MNNKTRRSRFLSLDMNRSFWLQLAFAATFLLLSVAQVVYRYNLPTDGWAVYTSDLDTQDWIFDTNLVGAPSGLQRDDRLVSVGGSSVQGTATLRYLDRPADWARGGTITMNVQRQGRVVNVKVPVVSWTFSSLWRYNFQNLTQFANLLGAIIFLVLGWLTFWRRSSLPSARALLMLSTAIGAAFISGVLPDGLSVQFDRLAFAATSFYSYLIFGTFLAPSLLAFSLLFPQPKNAIQSRPWLALLPYGIGLSLLTYFLAGGQSSQAGWYTTLSMFVASMLSLVHSGFTQRDEISAAQLRWAVSGFVLGLGLFMLNFPLSFGWVTHPVLVKVLLVAASLGLAVIGTGFAVAVLRYRLYDIDIIIRKTLIYAVLTGTLALVFFLSVVLLQRFLPLQSQLGTVMSTLAIAAIFSPLRRRIQFVIDRLFYRHKYDIEHILAAFSENAREEVDLERLSLGLLALVDDTISPKSLSLWIRESMD